MIVEIIFIKDGKKVQFITTDKEKYIINKLWDASDDYLKKFKDNILFKDVNNYCDLTLKHWQLMISKILLDISFYKTFDILKNQTHNSVLSLAFMFAGIEKKLDQLLSSDAILKINILDSHVEFIFNVSSRVSVDIL